MPTPSRCTIDSVDRAATKTALACPQSVHRCTSTDITLHQRLSSRWQRLLNARVPGDGGAGATAGCTLTHGAAAAQSHGDRLIDGVRSQCEGVPYCIGIAAAGVSCWGNGADVRDAGTGGGRLSGAAGDWGCTRSGRDQPQLGPPRHALAPGSPSQQMSGPKPDFVSMSVQAVDAHGWSALGWWACGGVRRCPTNRRRAPPLPDVVEDGPTTTTHGPY